MRAGACAAAQQTLSAEAASVLKHSLSLARRRGHGQVTPLHVAATLLGSRTGALRRACLKSQPHQPSHPLHSRALDLCFNVALNRLPATASPFLHAQPTLSNALVAALKRAQAHQRRGSLEQQQQQQQQQQPVIAIKVELEQLILSILDDPSVSRVMREAGFSSTLVKNSLEESHSSVFQCYNTAGGIYSTPNSPPNEAQKSPGNFWHSQLLSHSSEQNGTLFSTLNKQPFSGSYSFKGDIELVLDVLLRKKRRRIVLVGDSLPLIDGLVSEFMANLEGGHVPEDLKSAHLIKFQFSSIPLRLMKREEVDMCVSDLKRKVDSFASGGGVLIFTGDLKWLVETYGDEKEDGGAKAPFFYSPVDHLVSEMAKLVSMYNTSASKVWLIATASYQTYLKCQMRQPPLDLQWSLQPVSVPSGGLSLTLDPTSGHDSRTVTFPEEDETSLSCCQECKFNYEKEVSLKSFGSSPLPLWLKPSVKDDLAQLRRKYNKMCHNLHQGSNNTSSIFSSDETYPWKKKNHGHSSLFSSWPNKRNIFSDSETTPFGVASLSGFRRQNSCHIEFSFSNGSSKDRSIEPNLDSLRLTEGKQVKISLGLGNPQSQKKLELCDDLRGILQDNVPWQSEHISLILEALSGEDEDDSFILIQGNDSVAKRRIATGIAKSFFGSTNSIFSMKMGSNTDAAHEKSVLEKALREGVVLIENVESANPEFAEFLLDRRDVAEAIVILTTDEEKRCSSRGDAVIQMKLLVTEGPVEEGISSNHFHKRKADWDLPNTARSQRIKELNLDLNAMADECDEAKEENPPNFSAAASGSSKIAQIIKTRIVLERNSEKDSLAAEMFMSKILDEVSGSRNVAANFSVEDRVLEDIFWGCGFYLNSLFEEWLREVLRPSLQSIDDTEGKRFSIRLCSSTGEAEGEGHCSGFMGTSLPRKIQVSCKP